MTDGDSLSSLKERYELTRFVLLRLLGLVYTAAYASLAYQVLPLVGSTGLTPASRYVAVALSHYGSPFQALLRDPSLFHLFAPSDTLLVVLSGLGLALSIAVLFGATNALVMFVLWALYRSFISIGQVWYSYGWELLLVEVGFVAIFLCPLSSLRPLPRKSAPIRVLWLMRWIALRLMLGAGLIKLRGDSCWRDLTCLDFHFETQPLPNPVSPFLHALPHELLAFGVAFNHLCELVLPFFVFAPRRLRTLAALLMVVFQGVLIVSGNLSFLNYLTIVPLVACFDDAALARLLPRGLLQAERTPEAPCRAQRGAAWALAALVGLLSVQPVFNLLSPDQRMNDAFDPLMLVNSYGAFGSVGRERPELLFEGTRDAVLTKDSQWLAYEFPCKPGSLTRRPCVLSPLQLRLDWQVWFAAMGTPRSEPWSLHLIWKLLHADPGVRRLLAHDPFGSQPPRFVRVERYRYRFVPLGSEAWWTREYEGPWLPPLAADDPRLIENLKMLGYLPR